MKRSPRTAPPGGEPRSILLLKGHSVGIGDILRSSAAWRALKDRYPAAQLHLLLLTKSPGYPSESLLARHHLLTSFRALDKRTHGWTGWWRFQAAAQEFAAQRHPDLIIDFEPNGLRTSLLSFCLRRQCGARTLGVGQVPLRSLFYNLASVSMRQFARQRHLAWPLEYTHRDFVALSALGVERGETAIELRESEEGEHYRRDFHRRWGLSADRPLVGLNIGCGTADSTWKRPAFPLLSELLGQLPVPRPFHLVLTGADFETAVNRQFLEHHRPEAGAKIIDTAGQTSLLELAGLIRACRLFISSDSGPYHMAVALRTPTLAIFPHENRTHYHQHPWVRCVRARVLTDLPRLLEAAQELLGQPWPMAI